MLKVGIKKIDITPPKGLRLVGYPHYPRHNKGYHDPLHATCMYVSNGKCEVAMIALDLLFFSKAYTSRVRALAEKLCGIRGANVMISCTHTHSAPVVYDTMEDEDIEDRRDEIAYSLELCDKLVAMIAEAKADAFEGYFGSAVAVCGAESGVGGNRRFRGGPHDPLVTVMAVKDMNDNVKGALVNYSLHPTFIHEWTEVCTADFPCYVKMQVEESIPGVLAGFTQGASGNQSSRYYRTGESFDEAERVGRTLGRAAVSAIEGMEWKNDIEIKVATAAMPMEFRDMGSEEELEKQVAIDTARYKELYAKYGKSTVREEYYLWQNANLKCLGSEDRLELVRKMKTENWRRFVNAEGPAEIHAIALDDICVIGVPGEVFVEYSLYVKAMAGFAKVSFNTVTNGCLPGYLYTPESLLTGGYETDNSVLSEEFGENLVNLAIQTVKTIRNK